MSYFERLTLTKKGKEMILSSNTNVDRMITFTSASIGSEKLLPSEIQEALDIKNSWIKTPLNSVRIVTDQDQVFLRTEIAFTNSEITENKLMSELGLYAKFDGEDEFLFAYSVTDDNGETIPKGDIVSATYKFTVDSSVSTETKINQTLNPEGFLTREVIEIFKETIRNIAPATKEKLGCVIIGDNINVTEEGIITANVKKTDLVNLVSSVIVASATAVKKAYDKGVEAFNLATTNKKAILNNSEQIERLDDYATAIVGVNQNTRIAVGNASTSIKTNMVPNRLYQVFIHHGVSDGCGLWYVFYTPNGQKQFKVFATNYIETNIEIWQNLSGSLTINNKSGTNVEVDISAHTTGVNRTNDIDKF